MCVCSKILDCVIEPMLKMSSLSAVNLPAIDMAVYMINCIYTIHSMLSLYEYTDSKLERLDAQVLLMKHFKNPIVFHFNIVF